MRRRSRYILVGEADDVNATGYERDGMRTVYHPYAQTRTDGQSEDASLLKEQRYRRNMVTSHEFIRSVLNHMGLRSYYDRVTALFDASMAKGKFRFGSRATCIIGACILITMREAGIPETLKSLAARLKVTPATLTGSTYKILSLHGMHLKSSDPLNYIPAVIQALADILASPNVSIPAPLRKYLSTPSLNAVQNLATDLCYLTEIVNLMHNRQAPPVACALVIVALEGETGKCVPSLPRLTEMFSIALNVGKETISDRYLDVQELLCRLKTSLPWHALDVHPTVEKKQQKSKKRKATQPQREGHAGLIKDIVVFQEELWRKSKEVESAAEASSNGGPSQSSELGVVGTQSDLVLVLEESDEDAASDEDMDFPDGKTSGARDEETLELAGSPSTPGSTTDTASDTTASAEPGIPAKIDAANSARGLSPLLTDTDDGQDSDARPAKRQRRVPDGATTKLRDKRSTTQTKSPTLRPAYAQRSKKRKSKRETWDANLAKATATLLGGGRQRSGSLSSSGKTGSTSFGIGDYKDDSVGDFVREHVLAMGIQEASARMGARGVLLGRLERLAIRVGEANIGDELLFDDGELEGYLRDNEGVEIFRRVWEAEHGVEEEGQVELEGAVPGSGLTVGGKSRKGSSPSKPKKGKKEKQVKTMNLGALESALSSLGGVGVDSSGASSVTGEESTIESWELDLLERLADDNQDEEEAGYGQADDDREGGYGDDDADGYYHSSAPRGGMSYDPYEEFEEV